MFSHWTGIEADLRFVIQVHGGAWNIPGSLKQAPVFLSCAVADSDPGLGIPFFSRDDIEGLAAFLEAHHG